MATSSFAGVSAVGGVELFIGAAPRPLRMFYYTGEGVFAARLGRAGRPAAPIWAVREACPSRRSPSRGGTARPSPCASGRAETSTEPKQRAPNRYMTGVRVWVNTTVDLATGPAWQMSGGIEFEPAGSFRYLLGMY